MKKVSIIGGGITGATTGIFLSRIQSGAGRPLYDVTIHECRADIMEGASLNLARLHMGGEYPLDKTTALNCVTGAFLFAQVFPAAVFSEIKGIDYLVTIKSEESGILTAGCLAERYQMNADRYRHCYRLAKKQNYHSALGNPDTLFRLLGRHELNPVFSGGIRTKEWGLNSPHLNSFIKKQLAGICNIKVVTGDKIDGACKHKGGYLLTTTAGTPTYADIVINTSWENAYFLDAQIRTPADSLKVYLRAVAMADISNCPKKGNPAFALIGADGGMYSPVSKDRAILYVPSDDISHISSVELTPENLQVPKQWYAPLADLEQRKAKMHAHITHLHPQLAKMDILGMNVRPTLSFDNVLEKRRYAGPVTIADNWISVTSTKATFAAWAALETLKLVHPSAAQHFDLESSPVVPDNLRLG